MRMFNQSTESWGSAHAKLSIVITLAVQTP